MLQTIVSNWIMDAGVVEVHILTINSLHAGGFFIPPANFFCGLYPSQTLFVVGILFSRCPSVVLAAVTFCFLNILKSHCWNFIKLCKHVHIYKTNTLNTKVRARSQFY